MSLKTEPNILEDGTKRLFRNVGN